jgi:hypothetical protein
MNTQAAVVASSTNTQGHNGYDKEKADSRMNAIIWPKQYTPGTTDNFVTNETIVAGLTAANVWPLLANTSAWPTYYDNASDIRFYNVPGPELSKGARFRFTTFGFPVEAEVLEYVAPVNGQPGRLAWHGWVDGTADTKLDVYHAWLIEDLPGGRVRILTQESQIGKPAQALANSKPNTMVNGHQNWIEGLVRTAQQNKK